MIMEIYECPSQNSEVVRLVLAQSGILTTSKRLATSPPAMGCILLHALAQFGLIQVRK